MPTPEEIQARVAEVDPAGRWARFQVGDREEVVDLDASPYARGLVEEAQRARPTAPAAAPFDPSQVGKREQVMGPLVITGSPVSPTGAGPGFQDLGEGFVITPQGAQRITPEDPAYYQPTDPRRAAAEARLQARMRPPQAEPEHPLPTEADLVDQGYLQPSHEVPPTSPFAGIAREMQLADPSRATSTAPPYPDAVRAAPPGAAPPTPEGAPVPGRVRPRGAGGARRVPGTAPAEPDFLTTLGQAPSEAFRGAFPGDYRRESPLEVQRRLAAQQGQLAQRGAELQGIASAEMADAEAEGERRRLQLEEDRRGAMQAARQRYAQAAQRVAAMRVEPNHFFSDGGTAVGAAIAVALGAVGSAISGNDSYRQDAMGLIQQAIERDIQAQRDNISNAQAGLDAEGNIVGLMEQEFGDRAAAEEAARAALLQATARRIEGMESGLQNAQARQDAEALRLQIEQQAAAAQQAAIQAAEDRELQQRLLRARIAEREANALRAQRRAMGIGGRPRSVTAPQMQAYDAILGSVGGDRHRAAQLAGLPFVPDQGVVSGEQRTRLDALERAVRDVESLIPAGSYDASGEVAHGDRPDIPGIGAIDSRLPSALQGREGRILRQRAEAAARRYLRVESGGAITAEEEDAELDARGLGPGATEEQFLEGWRQMRADIQARLGRMGHGSSVSQQIDDSLAGAGVSIRTE